MYKYQIWREGGLLYDSKENSGTTYDHFGKALFEATAHAESYINDANDTTEDDYWYTIEEV